MNTKLMRSTVNITLLIGGLITMYFLQYDLKNGLSIAIGVLFSIANMYLLWKMILEIITTEKKNSSNIAGLIVLKFILLWGAFIAVMALNWASPMYLAIGFTIILAVLTLKGFGRWIVQYFGMTGRTTEE